MSRAEDEYHEEIEREAFARRIQEVPYIEPGLPPGTLADRFRRFLWRRRLLKGDGARYGEAAIRLARLGDHFALSKELRDGNGGARQREREKEGT